jgi:glutamyl-tRNA synthetase
MKKQMENLVMKFALSNAVTFNGKAQMGTIIGKLLHEDPEIKNELVTVSKDIQKILQKVNKMPFEIQKKELLKVEPDYFKNKKELGLKRKEERKELPELKNAIFGKVKTRIPPEPSKYPHFGHALSFLINYIYALKYKGKCVLRFEDTNPEKGAQEYVDAVFSDVIDYLDIKPNQTIFVSDHVEKYYTFAEGLIDKGLAFTCSCKRPEISKNRRLMKECSCRNKSKTTIKKEWREMKSGSLKEGSLTLRLKVDMKHKNAVMRDPVIFRLSYTPHYRQGTKYKVWPMYDFENAIEEGLLEITHVLRSNEFETRIELQNYIRNLFDLPNPVTKQYARFNITGATTKGREIREKIESGDYLGWDDPRLVTLRALRRRGIVKETYYEMAKIVGMSKTTSNLDFSVIASINRKLLDKKAKRFFFIEKPVLIKIKNAPPREIELDLHPEIKEGGRKFNVDEEFYIEENDFKNIKPEEIIRLMDCLNFTKEKNFIFKSLKYDEFKGKGSLIVHWLPKLGNSNVQIRMPDNTLIKGIAENNIQKLNIGDIIQFERFGFCRLDDVKDGIYSFWFSHK